jgi:hypothetical protein
MWFLIEALFGCREEEEAARREEEEAMRRMMQSTNYMEFTLFWGDG